MSLPDQLNKLVQNTTGPAPWYWETFPEVRGGGSRRYRWRFHGQQEGLNFLVSLHAEDEADNPRLVLNTTCCPFLIPAGKLGVWCTEALSVRFVCFDPQRLQSFPLEEIAGWFAPSSERLYSSTPPLGEFALSTTLAPGTHPLELPECFREVDELLVPVRRKVMESGDAAYAIYVVYPQAGLVDVQPQQWLTADGYDVNRQWITRATRNPETHRILGELSGKGIFELSSDGRQLERWL